MYLLCVHKIKLLIALSLCLLLVSPVSAAVNAGYSEFYIPGDEDNMMRVLEAIGQNTQNNGSGMHAVISVVAGAKDTVVYYDHWEDGYDFDETAPSTADETYTLTNRGDSRVFESTGIPLPRTTSMTACGGTPCYDGRDRLFISGGASTVTRASWTEMADTLLAVAWEVYPVRPQLTTYITPFGEDLYSSGLLDFERVFTLVQATSDGTTIQVDMDHDGTYDQLDWTRDGTADGTTVTLNAGEVFLLDRVSGMVSSVNTGVHIEGSDTLQVQYVIGDENSGYEVRGLSAFPRGFWDDDYYAPVDGAQSSLNDPTDIFLHNPHDFNITITYETTSVNGNFVLTPHQTRSFQEATGSWVPEDSAVYLKGTDAFWGVSTIDSEATTHDWGYSLVPNFMLESEHFMGWAPGADPVQTGSGADNSGIFVAPAQDNTRVFIDTNNDGAYDQDYTLNRLQTQYITDSTDGDMSQANVYSTGPITISYGQNPEVADAANPSIDVGYTTIPNGSFIELVLTVDKQTDPVVLPTAANNDATYNLTVESYDFEIEDVSVVDTLPAGWTYVNNTATITLADKTTVSTNPNISGGGLILTWPSSVLGSMEPNQEIIITFTARNTIVRAAGALTRNSVEVEGSRTVGGVTQTFTTTDFVFNTYGDLSMEKVTGGIDPLTPGDTYNYTVTVTNPETSLLTQTQVAIYDDLPEGISYVPGSSQVRSPLHTRAASSLQVEDNFSSASYSRQDGTDNWDSNWSETGDDSSANSGSILITGGRLRMQNDVRSIERTVDLSAYSSATLTYDWELDGDLENDDHIEVWIDSGGSSTLVAEYWGPNPDSGSETFTIPDAYTDTDTSIRFRVDDEFNGGDEYFYVDNVEITASLSAVEKPLRITQYYISGTDFSGGTYNLTLDQDLESDYFVIVRGSADGDTTRGPDDNYAALTADFWGTGDLGTSGATDKITLTRRGTDGNWVGVVTVVECLADQAGDGFTLRDVQLVNHGTAASGTDNSGPNWTDLGQVLLMGGFQGAGVTTTDINSVNHKASAARFWPSGTDTINWTRNGTAITLTAATSTVMVVEWGSEWLVQNVRAQSANGGDGANAAGEYQTTALPLTVPRDHTWVWGTGHTNDGGIGDGPEGVLVTLGDGVNQNATESMAAVGIEYADNAIDYQVWTMTHEDLHVDYRFKADGDTGLNQVNLTVDDTGIYTDRMVMVSNGCNGTGNAYPRPILSARYTGDATVQLERGYDGQNFPAWVQGIYFAPTVTASGHDAPNFVSAGDAYSLNAGEEMTLTFRVTVDNPLGTGIDTIQNWASLTTSQIPLPLSDDATNIVNNPSAQSASVGDTVWLDMDSDGIHDPAEPGLANVEVTLKNQFGLPLLTTTTDGNGHYLFTGVEPGGAYYVHVTGGLPPGLAQTFPSGHTDDKTDSFDLIAGQTYLDADLGYNTLAGTAIIGDFVWIDADGDGFQDAGEPGLGGVTVTLWLDDGDLSAELGPGEDDAPALAGTVTAPDGSYLFAGIAATGTQDYYVVVDATQAALTSYTSTTSEMYRVDDLDAGDAILTADFGFNNPAGVNTLFSIKDRVWFDSPDEDQNDDVGANDDGETGFTGVTVDLLDASRNIMTTVLTDADGYFEFTGVPGNGADYVVEITDTSGVLTDFYGTTPAALAGELDMDNLSANVDNTAEPTEPSFGYSISGVIGDTVFIDLDNDGVKDSNERGMGGVAVRLVDDADNDGLYDAGEAVLSTVITNTRGIYLFSGLNDGNYVVSIDTTPAGYNYTTEATDNDPAAGEQQAATISGGSTILDRDFGYLPPIPLVISGTIWEDDDENGVIGGTETRFANVTVELYRGAALIDSTTTDSAGYYYFDGLNPGNWTILVTDDTGVLDGYFTTYEVTEDVSSPHYNNLEAISLMGSDVTGINFGYKKDYVTFAALSDFDMCRQGDGSVVLRWSTSLEINTAGFLLYRQEGGRVAELLNSTLLPAVGGSSHGGNYSFVDTRVPKDLPIIYTLKEREALGATRDLESRLLEPDTPACTTQSNPPAGYSFSSQAQNLNKAMPVALAMKAFAPSQAASYKPGNTDEPLQILVDEEGIYRVTLASMAAAWGVEPAQARELLESKGLYLSNMGDPVTWFEDPREEGILFYGTAPKDIYASQNVYWLSKLPEPQGQGTDLSRVSASPVDLQALELSNSDSSNCFVETSLWPNMVIAASQLAQDSFQDRLVLEQNISDVSHLFDDPQADFWIWETLYAGWAGWDSKNFDFELFGLAPLETEARLTLHLLGGTKTGFPADHHAEVYINGDPVGGVSWQGAAPQKADFNFEPAVLQEGQNTITVSALLDTGAPYSIFMVDGFELEYPRQYTAANNRLNLPMADKSPITIAGFTDSQVLVLDLESKDNPLPLSYESLGEGKGGSIRFEPMSPSAPHAVWGLDSLLTPVSIRAKEPSDLRNAENRAGYLIVAPTELVEQSQRLSEYRAEQGLEAMVVQLSHIMDEFNYGVSHPKAIAAFLFHAHQNWERAPEYVLLAGRGTTDYKNHTGFEDNLIPPLLAGTPDGLFASDNLFRAFEGGPAIGRLPAADAVELGVMIDKIMAYEKEPAQSWARKVMLLADNPDPAGSFDKNNNDLATLFDPSLQVEKIYLPQYAGAAELEQARTQALSSLNSGALLVNYAGHGGLDRFSQEGLITSADAAGLQNKSKLPLVTALTCVTGMSVPGWPGLGETLMNNEGGGAIAVWSPSGLSRNQDAATMAKHLFQVLMGSGKTTLGQAVNHALATSAPAVEAPYMLQIYNLFGDPALTLKAPPTP